MVKIGGREVNKKDTVDVECMYIGRIRQLHHSKDTALHCIASHIKLCAVNDKMSVEGQAPSQWRCTSLPP